MDAEAIEEAASNMKRPTARMHLEALCKKLRKESEALKRVENSKQKAAEDDAEKTHELAGDTRAYPPETTRSPASAPTPAAVACPAPPPTVSETMKYIPVDRFSFDAGSYNSPFITLYVSLPGVGSIDPSKVKCKFTPSTFDLVVHDLNGKSYRLYKDNLENDIDAEKSKIIVKADKVIVKLAKLKKGDYGGYDYWSKLTDPKKRSKGKSSSKDDPHKSIMDLMKDMYEGGDDNMKKIIGETMMKQQRGELGKGDMDFDKDLGDL